MPFITSNGTIISVGVGCSGHIGVNGAPIAALEAIQAVEGECVGGAVLLGPNVLLYQRCAPGDADCRLESINLTTEAITIISEIGASFIVGSGQGDWAAGLAAPSGVYYRDSLGRRAEGSFAAGLGDDYTGKWCATVSYSNDSGIVILDKYGNVTTLTDGSYNVGDQNAGLPVHLRNDIAAFARGNAVYFSSGERSLVRTLGFRHTGRAHSDDLWVSSWDQTSEAVVVWKVGDEGNALVAARGERNYYPDLHEYANGMLLLVTSAGQGDTYSDLQQFVIDPDAGTVNGVTVATVDIRATEVVTIPVGEAVIQTTTTETVQEGPDPLKDDYVTTSARPDPLWKTAAKGITPQLGLTEDDIVYNLALLAQNVLQPVKDVYPNIVVRSGFRQVNSGISAHERGQAVDLQIQNQTPELLLEVADFIAKELRFDQLILNYSETPAQSWIHVSFDEQSLSQTVKTRDFDDTFHDGLHLITPLTGEARAAKQREYESYVNAINAEIANLEAREEKLAVKTVYADALVETGNGGTGFDCGAAAPIPMDEDGLTVVTRVFDAGRNGQPWDLTNPDYEAYNGCGQFVEAVIDALPGSWGHLMRDGYAPEAFGHAVDAILYKSDTPLYNGKYYQLVYIIESPGRPDAAPFWLPTCEPTGDAVADAPQGGWSRDPITQPTVAPGAQFGYVRADLDANTWTASTGTSLFSTIDEPGFSNDADYIESAESDGLLTIQLREEYTLIAEWTKYRVSGAETYEFTVTEAQWRTVSDWTKLALWLTVNETETAKFAFGELTPPTHGSLTLRLRIDMGL